VCLDKLDNQAGMDSAWVQEKLEARKMLAVGAADRASEPQANIAHPKRLTLGLPSVRRTREDGGPSFYTRERWSIQNSVANQILLAKSAI